MQSLREVLMAADSARIAVGHFNISEMVAFNAIVEGAKALNVPVMVGVSEGERSFVGVKLAAAMVRAARETSGLPIFLNADHTHSLEKAEEAARAGFDEIIFDGSSKPLEQNIVDTRRAVEALKSINPAILIEGEIGYIGASSVIMEKAPEGIALTTPEEARQFVAETKVDILAPAVGNMHGMLESMVRGEGAKRLDLGRVAAIKEAVHIPMTLHGGSGTDDNDFRAAIKAGMTIVHVNTELRLAWRQSIDKSLQADPNQVVPYKILAPVLDAVRAVVERRLRLFSGR